jgi:plastocyanin
MTSTSIATATRRGSILLLLLLLGARPPRAPQTHVIRLTGNRFEPAATRAIAGDTLRFVNGNGGPHNVQFEADSIAGPARKLLESSMSGAKIGPMSSPLLIIQDEEYRFVVPPVDEGRYPFVCLPHYANMRGSLLVLRSR